MFRFFALFLIILGMFSVYHLYSEEVDHGFVIVDRKPWKVAWVKEDNNTWVLVANFDKGESRTYFKKAPPEKGLGLAHDNQPIKQEFKFYFGEKFTSTACQFEQWPDGCKAYGFTYNKKFSRGGENFFLGVISIIQEINGAEDEIRYSIYRNFE